MRTKLEAKENCIQNNGKLWEPNTIERINQIYSKVKDLTTAWVGVNDAAYWWVGINDAASEGTFRYDSNEEISPFTPGKLSSSMSFYVESTSTQNCVLMDEHGMHDVKCVNFVSASACELSSE